MRCSPTRDGSAGNRVLARARAVLSSAKGVEGVRMLRVARVVCGRARRRALPCVATALMIAVTTACACANAGGVKAMWGPATRDGVSQFPIYRELGVKVYEDDLSWAQIATRRPRNPRDPRDPAYVWPAEV